MADEDNEVGLPQKGLNMIIKDVLPDMRIANESRELLNQCCAEFVKYLSREAQRISSNDQRKTIYHEHVQKGEWFPASVWVLVGFHWFGQKSTTAKAASLGYNLADLRDAHKFSSMVKTWALTRKRQA